MDLIIRGLLIPVEKDGIDEYLTTASQKLNIDKEAIRLKRILNKSLDIRDKEQFYYNISIVISVPEGFSNTANFESYTETIKEEIKPVRRIRERPVIIGFGPAGMFAALELIRHGIKPIVFERGKKIEERSIDVDRFINQRILNPESNIQFGEGGAGSYSDGKLFSRTRNSDCINKVLNTFIKFGAPGEIGYVSKPHLGTDVLCHIVHNIRNYILARGGEIYYNSKMTDIIITDDQATGIVINGEREYHCQSIYLAVGHSARDTFEMLHNKGVMIEQKPISVGVRIEHPAEVINLIRYGHKYKDSSFIGAANYSFTYTNRKIKRGVYTFCMCPGGEIVNASSEEGQIVVNGMSYSQRASKYSNSAIVVTCHTDDYKSGHQLAGIEFQRAIERRAFNSGGRTWKVPAQNLPDFLNGRTSNSLNANSCKIGTNPADLNDIFPEFINEMLLAAFNFWKKDYPLFVSDDAILLGAETRTSAPLRIKRDRNFQSVNIKRLYPIGEGSGYTGGIVSSASDALKAVEAAIISDR